MNILSLDHYLKGFFEGEKKSLKAYYPGITLHRLRQDIKLCAILHNIDSEELFELAYLPSQDHPLTIFFEQLKKGVPLEYITGFAYFYQSLFRVTKDVLIPRSETEILVELAGQEIQKNYRNKPCRIIDIGTGSGVIGLSLLTLPHVQIDMVLSDISEKALKVARENFFNQKYLFPKSHKISFQKSDRMREVHGVFDLILSNPPYIKRGQDLSEVHDQVKIFEPHLALFLDDGLYDQWFNEFFTSIYEKLSPSGISLIEGHENHLESLATQALKVGFAEVLVIKDYTQRNRFLQLKKNK